MEGAEITMQTAVIADSQKQQSTGKCQGANLWSYVWHLLKVSKPDRTQGIALCHQPAEQEAAHCLRRPSPAEQRVQGP